MGPSLRPLAQLFCFLPRRGNLWVTVFRATTRATLPRIKFASAALMKGLASRCAGANHRAWLSQVLPTRECDYRVGHVVLSRPPTEESLHQVQQLPLVGGNKRDNAGVAAPKVLVTGPHQWKSVSLPWTRNPNTPASCAGGLSAATSAALERALC